MQIKQEVFEDMIYQIAEQNMIINCMTCGSLKKENCPHYAAELTDTIIFHRDRILKMNETSSCSH
jgi:hypothetical protein